MNDNMQSDEQLQHYKSFIKHIPNIIYKFSNKRGALFWSDNIKDILGYELVEMQEDPFIWNRSIHPEDKPRIAEAIQNFNKGEKYSIEYRIQTKFGQWIWLHDYFMHKSQEKDEIIIEGFASDITERKQLEIELAKSKQRFDLAMQATNDGIFDWNLITNEIYYSPNWKHILGYRDNELENHFSIWEQLTHPEDVARSWKMLHDHIEGNRKRFEIEFRMKHKGGHWVNILSRANAYRDENGKVYRVVGTHIDISERIKANADLEDSHLQLNNSQKVARIGSYYLDIATGTWSSSETLDEIFGLAANCPKNIKTWLSLIHPKFKKELLDYLQINVITNHEKFNKRYIIINAKNKNEYWVHGLGSLEFDKDGIPIKMFGTIQDISHIKQYEDDIIKEKNNAEMANQLKTEFLANMSHEIRTPMNAVLGYTEILSKKLSHNKDCLEYIDGIRKSGQNLISLINDILDLSKIEAGRMEIIPEPINFYSKLNDIRQIFSIKIKQKKLDFHTHIDKKLPKFLMLDRKRIRQILFNLVGNAIKFTEQGFISISIYVDGQPTSTDCIDLCIEVADSGIGISMEDLQHIFEPFKQVHSQFKTIDSSGLGLSITKRLVEAMQGHLITESSPGKGSIFKVKLKNVQVPVQQEIIMENNSMVYQNIIFHSPFILLVDDVESNLKVLSHCLQELNCRIIIARDGQEALDLLHTNPVDLVFMDIQMPILDGYQATQKIKSKENLKQIPIIALTALALKEQEEKYNKVFDGYLKKPILMNDLITCLKDFFPFDVIEEEKPTLKSTDIFPPEWPPEFIEQLHEEVFPLFEDLYEFFDTENSLLFIKKFRYCIEQSPNNQWLDFCNSLENATVNMHLSNIKKLLNEFKKFKDRFQGQFL